jgi:galactose oxidase
MTTMWVRGRVGWRSSVAVASVAALVIAATTSDPGASRAGMAQNPRSAAPAVSDPDPMTVPVAAYTPDAPTLQREGWTAAASQSSAGHPAAAALDSDALSYWAAHTDSAAPASITVDMRAPQVVSGLVYEPPQTPSPVDVIGQYKVSVSMDGAAFTTVATGTWSNTTAVKNVGIAAVDTRFVRLTALNSASGSGSTVAAAELYLQGTPTVTAPLAATKAAAKSAAISTNPSVVGQWGPTIGFPIVPVAAALLPNNELLVWSADQATTYGGPNDPYTMTAILNLNTGAVSEDTVSNTGDNMFCPGVSILPDGEIMVTGGLSNQQTSIYNPTTNTWRAGPLMNIGRGYQGQTTLSNGQAFVLGGSWSGVIGGKLGEIWSPSGGWRELTGVPATPMYTQDAQGAYRADNHGWFISTSGGNVLQAGPSAHMNWITTSGAGTITPAGNRGASADAMNGNAVYYDVNKVVTMGGAPSYQNSTATNQAYQIQIPALGTNPTVTQSGSMTYPRAFANSVALPNGQVVTMGGETYAVPFSDANSVLNAELWDPTTNAFSVMAPEATPRNYHSVGVLLPDGTVFSGGGGLCGTCSTNHEDGQIFSPPYLFNADGSLRTRPTIVSAPTSAATGQTITVTTGGPVSQFSMVRYGESTHSVDNDQRRIPLQILSQSGNTYQLAIPSDPGIALPGPYMLFAMDANGTPSISTTISITNVASQPPANHYGQTIYGDSPASYWPLSENGGTTAADVSGNNDSGNYQGGGFTYGVPSPAEGVGGQGVTLNGSTSQIVASQPITNPTSYSEEVWFNTTTTTGGLLTGFGTAASGTASTSRDRLVYMANNGQIYFGVYAGTPVVITSPGKYNDGQWHHLVATQGSDGMHLYVDGQQVASNATTTTAQSYLGYWRVGGDSLPGWSNSPTSGFFAGSVSDAAFYNTELTAAQVLTHYQAAGGSCPSSWSCTDIGGPLPAGKQAVSGSTWSVTGGGGDIWGTADAFHYIDQPLAADGTVTALVSTQTNSSAWAKAGVMLRATTDPGSPYYAAFVTPANGIAVQWRTAQGASTSQLGITGTVPTYLRIARYTAGTTVYYTAYTSADGTNWTAVPGSSRTVPGLSGTLLGGMAVTSHNQGTGSTVGFGAPTVSATEFPPPGLSCPTGWTCSDIGGPLPLGQQTLTGGQWSLLGGGGDIWSTADAFHFVNQSLAANGSISAHVTAQANTSAWAKTGVMLRSTTDPGSPYYAAFVTPAHGIVVQWRTAQGGSSAQVSTTGTVPTYLEVARTGSSFTAYTSSDGVTWTAVPGSTVTLANLGGPILRGLAVTSHNQGTGDTVTMDTVATVG